MNTAGRFDHIFWKSAGLTPNTLSTRMEGLYVDHPTRRVPLAERTAAGRPSAVSRLDVRTMSVADGYAFAEGLAASSPLFLPRRGSQGELDGYLLVTVVSDEPSASSSGDEFWVFDPADLQAGPRCRLGHPSVNMPYAIHTAWMDTVEPAPREHVLSVRDDYADVLGDPRIRSLFEAEVFPRFA